MPLGSREDVTIGALTDPGSRRILLEAIDAIEALEAREVIELAVVRLAAARRTSADLDRLRLLLEGMRRSRDEPLAFAELHFAMHVALTDAARNTLLASSLSTLYEGMRAMIERFATTAAEDDRMDALIDSHAQLVEAVGRRDAQEAALIVSDMMSVLRIESGQCRPRRKDPVIGRRVPQIGILDDRPHDKGDRP